MEVEGDEEDATECNIFKKPASVSAPLKKPAGMHDKGEEANEVPEDEGDDDEADAEEDEEEDEEDEEEEEDEEDEDDDEEERATRVMKKPAGVGSPARRMASPKVSVSTMKRPSAAR